MSNSFGCSALASRANLLCWHRILKMNTNFALLCFKFLCFLSDVRTKCKHSQRRADARQERACAGWRKNFFEFTNHIWTDLNRSEQKLLKLDELFRQFHHATFFIEKLFSWMFIVKLMFNSWMFNEHYSCNFNVRREILIFKLHEILHWILLNSIKFH